MSGVEMQAPADWTLKVGCSIRERPERCLPYIYIDKVLNELRDELLSAMHAAVDRELRQGRVDVGKLYRAFARAAAKQAANPVFVSDKCVEMKMTKTNKGLHARDDD